MLRTLSFCGGVESRNVRGCNSEYNGLRHYDIDGTSFTVNLGAGNGVSLNPAEADSFLQVIFGKAASAIPLGSLLIWRPVDGAKLDGLPGDTYVIPINQKLGIVSLKTLTLHFQPAGAGVQFCAALDGSGALGPFQMSVQGIGVMDAGPISGAGFLSIDQPNGRYAGILQLNSSASASPPSACWTPKSQAGFHSW